MDPTPFALLGSICFVMLMIWAAAEDAATLKIRNGTTLALAAAFLILAVPAGLGAAQIGAGVVTGASVLGLGIVLFAGGLIGAGDAKLAAATALWLGPEATPAYLVFTTLVGGALGLAVLGFRALPLPLRFARCTGLRRLHRAGAGLPYGLALGPAAIMALPPSPWLAFAAG